MRTGVDRRLLLGVATLTLLAFLLRLHGLRQSLFGDELFSHHIATRSTPRGALDAIHNSENTPPLYYGLAWLAAKLGNSTYAIRVPTLLAATATVPLTWALGRRLAGEVAALVAAGLVTLSPFWIFYGSEARAYALATALAATSTLLLLTALERPRGEAQRLWAAYAVVATLTLYSHYVAGLVLAAQGAWALAVHRDRLREVLIAHAVALAAFAPWVPSLRTNGGLTSIQLLAPTTVHNVLRFTSDFLWGFPYLDRAAVPGTPALVALAGFVLAAVAGLVLGGARRLMALRLGPVPWIVLATPLGLLTYSLVSDDIYLSRNLVCALPALAVLVGAVAQSLPTRERAAALTLLIVGLGLSAASTLKTEVARPNTRAVAQALDREAAPDTPVLDVELLPYGPLAGSLKIMFKHSHRRYLTAVSDGPPWSAAGRARRSYLAIPEQLLGPARAQLVSHRLRVVGERRFDGIFGYRLLTLEPAREP